jgi:hypothetical protein
MFSTGAPTANSTPPTSTPPMLAAVADNLVRRLERLGYDITLAPPPLAAEGACSPNTHTPSLGPPIKL